MIVTEGKDQFMTGAIAEQKEKSARELQTMSEQSPAFFTETIPAAFRVDNPMVSAIVSNSIEHVTDRYDPTYYPTDDLGGFMDGEYDEQLVQAKNAEHMQAMKEDIQRENKDRELLGNAGGEFLARMAAGILSPEVLLPSGAVIKGAKGFGYAKAATQSAAIGGLSVGVSEAALQATQKTRTMEESMVNIGGAALLVGALGFGTSYLSRAQFDELAVKMAADMKPKPPLKDLDPLTGSVSFEDLGAAAAKKMTLDDLSIQGKAASFASSVTRMVNPFNRMMNSPFASARESFQRMIEIPMQVKANADGRTLGTAAETELKLYDKGMAEAFDVTQKTFKAYKKREKSIGARPMSMVEYRERISYAMRNGDIDEMGVAEITQAAQKIRQSVFEPLKKQAIELGLLPEGIEAKFADSYLTRVWRKEKIIGNMPEAKAMFTRWAERKVGEHVERVNKAVERVKLSQAKTAAEYAQKAQNVRNKKTPFEKFKVSTSTISDYEDSLRSYLRKELDDATFESLSSIEGFDGVLSAVDFILKAPKKPESIIDFARKTGGIIDESGDLASMGVKFGKGKNKAKTLDEIGQILFDEGFYPHRPTPAEILSDISDEVNLGNIKARASDEGLLVEYISHSDNAQYVEQFLDELGINPNTFKADLKAEAKGLRAKIRAERSTLKDKSAGIRVGAQRMREYFKPHLENYQKAAKRLDEVSERLAKNYEKKAAAQAERSLQRIEKLSRELSAFKNANNDGFDEYINDVVNEVINKMTGVGMNEAPDFIAPITRGPLKEKLLDISDNEAAQFLENNIDSIISRYTNQMGSEIALTRQFGRADMADQFKALDDEFAEMRTAAEGNTELTKKLQREYEVAKKDLSDLRDLMRGTYRKSKDPDGALSQIGTILRDLQYMSKLGGVTISSLPDVFRTTMVHGMDRAFGDLVSRLKMPKALRLASKEELQEIGFGWETVLNTRLSTLADISDPYARGTALTRATGHLSAGFSRMTMINTWNDMMKSWAANVTQGRVLKNIGDMAGGKLNPKERAYLAYLGIDADVAKVIHSQFKKHGRKEGQAYLSGIKNWDADRSVEHAARIYKAALRKEADSIIVTKGLADVPSFANTPAGGLALQFKSFVFAAHQRVLLRGLQDADAKTAMGVVMMIAGGMMTAAIKKAERDVSIGLRGGNKQEDLQDWDASKWLVEGIDRSGVFSLVWEVNNIYEKGGGYGLTQMIGQPPASRFASRNIAGAIMGPTVGTMADMASILGVINSPLTGRENTKADIRAIRNNIPMQNLIGLRYLFDAIEGKAVDATGAK